MERALISPAPARRARRLLPEMLFTSPWAALAIPLVVPLLLLIV